MSHTIQAAIQSQQQGRGRPHTASQQVYPPVQQRFSAPQLSQAITTYHVEGLVVNYLEQYPGFFAGLLVKHEQWLARYIREQYNIKLPTRKAVLLKHPSSSLHTGGLPKSNSTGATPQRSAHSSTTNANQPTPRKPENAVHVDLTAPQTSRSSSPCKPNATLQELFRTSRSVEDRQYPLTENISTQSSSSAIQRSTKYQKPIVENVTSSDSTYRYRGDSPKSTSSQPSTWPTEEDLNVPYPAPDNCTEKEARLNKGKGFKWTFEEQDWAIGYMYEMRDDPNIPKTEKRFDEVSRRLKEEHQIDRSKDSVKNMWNRIGRYRSKYDERKNKSAPLATSQQGKQARMENEAKKTGKRKASEEPAATEPMQKKTKIASVDPTLTENGEWGFLSSIQANEVYTNIPQTVHASQIQPLQPGCQIAPSNPAPAALPIADLVTNDFEPNDPYADIDFNQTMSDADLARILAYDPVAEVGFGMGFC